MYEGSVFGALTLLAKIPGDSRWRYYARCACGNETKVRPDAAKSGRVKSCGCGINANRIDQSIRRQQDCESCHKSFVAIKDGDKWPKFCSRDCFTADVRDRAAKRSITKVCDGCGATFKVGPSRSEAMFCTRACQIKANARPCKEAACEQCGAAFVSRLTGGKYPKFCQIDCYLASKRLESPETVEKTCPGCDSVFTAERSRVSDDGYRIYCSLKCRSQCQQAGEERLCVNCGNTFYAKRREIDSDSGNCCSAKCRSAHYQGVNSKLFVGSYDDGATGKKILYFPRAGFSSKYIAEHRIVAASAIGRLLHPSEPVIHLNNKLEDNRPENLFICKTNGEMVRRSAGALPWPQESNLGTYK